MKKNIINTNSGVYLNYGYLTLPLNLSIASKIEINSRNFYSKTGYHVSLLYLGKLYKTEQEKILNFAKKYDLNLTHITNEYRLVKHEEQQSIIVRVRLYGLKKLISDIKSHLHYDFMYPPTHITLFNLKGQYGIGINSTSEYNKLTSQISKRYSSKLFKSFKII